MSACGRSGESFFDYPLLLTDVDGCLSRDDFWRQGSQLLDLKLLEVLRCNLCVSAGPCFLHASRRCLTDAHEQQLPKCKQSAVFACSRSPPRLAILQPRYPRSVITHAPMPLLAPESPPSRPCPMQAAAACERTVPTQTRQGAPGAYIVLRGYILTAPWRRWGSGVSAQWRATVAGGEGTGRRAAAGRLRWWEEAGAHRRGGVQAAFCFPLPAAEPEGQPPPPCTRLCTGLQLERMYSPLFFCIYRHTLS